MTEQIYINGILMEQTSGKNASLIFQSPLFTDIDSIVSNRTNSIEFPATPGNLAAIENCHLSSSESKFAYRKHKVLYYLDGVQIFSGYGTLISCTPSAVKFSFTWGNVSAFQKLLDLKIRELVDNNADGGYVDYNYSAHMSDFEHYDRNIDYGVGGGTYGEGLVLTGVPHPFMPVSRILGALEAASGVTLNGAERFEKYVLPLVTKNSDEYANVYNAVHFTGGTAVELGTDSYWRFYGLKKTTGTDNQNWALGSKGMFNVSNVEKLGVKIPANGLRFTVSSSASVYGIVAVFGSEDEDAEERTSLAQLTVSRNGDVFTNAEEIDQVIDVSKHDFIGIQLLLVANRGTASIPINTADIYLYDAGATEVKYGAKFPLWKNLPDWTGSQLLKNLMKLEGVFPRVVFNETENGGEVQYSQAIEFLSVDDIFSHRAIAPDWTDKIILSNGLPAEKTATFGSYAQNNVCKYAEDTTNLYTQNAVLKVENEALDKEGDLISLDFASTDTATNGHPVIHAYTRKTDDDGNSSVEFAEVGPRILRFVGAPDEYGRDFTTAKDLDWETLLKTKYFTYQQVVKFPKVIKATAILDAVDIASLDLTIPVFSFALGHYYAINKLTTKDGGMAELELLQLGTINAVTDIPASFTDLTLMTDGDGNHYATFPSQKPEVITAIRLDGRYKLLLIREGYARRGKYFTYTNPQGVKQTTHADRKNFRKFRFGEKWRIIGNELLENGRISGHSQTLQGYGDCTLVTTLLETITLPTIDTDSCRWKRAKSRRGFIMNRDRDGMCELYVALYHRGDGGWECISNKVRVRGRNAACTQVWEFNESNVVMQI